VKHRPPAALAGAIAAAAIAWSCGSVSTLPPTSPTTGSVTTGRVVDAITEGGVGSIAISGPAIARTASDASGAFVVNAQTDGVQSVEFNGAAIVTRQTTVRVPGPAAVVPLIPSSFDLVAFDQMFRVSQLLRWTDPPPLVVQRRVLPFTGVNDSDFTAGAELMTDGDVQGLVADLQWALPQLTGGHFTAFSRVAAQSADPNTVVHILNSGTITVARYTGLTAATGFWGYSRWQFRADGSINGGTTMLDRDFDRSGSAFQRSLRAHELGHTLGYNHVTARPSVMNAAARIEPNDFDREASRIAFQRPPGNHSPDNDPATFSTNRVGVAAWSAPVP